MDRTAGRRLSTNIEDRRRDDSSVAKAFLDWAVQLGPLNDPAQQLERIKSNRARREREMMVRLLMGEK